MSSAESPSFDTVERKTTTIYPFTHSDRPAWSPASWSRSQRWKKRVLSHSLHRPLDRVNVLGSDTYGHTGCVNALSWAKDGEILLTGGDDCDVRIWRMDSSNLDQEYPFFCSSVLHTGHRGNIFCNKMLPFSSRIATVAGDSQVRVFDIANAVGRPGRDRETEYNTREACISISHCHDRRTKKIVTEDSPDLFLTVAEDGTVRQHDLRNPHTCNTDRCPEPLIKVPHDLNAIGLSPLAPYQFVVAGESAYGYLFDRRQTGRFLQEEWGMPPDPDGVTTCVRRFCRKKRARGERKGREHVTGVRMAQSNSHEVLLSYSSDGVYLFSTRDDPEVGDDFRSKSPSVLPSNAKRRKLDETSPAPEQDAEQNEGDADGSSDADMSEAHDLDIQELLDHVMRGVDVEDVEDAHHHDDDDDEDNGEDEDEDAAHNDDFENEVYDDAPVIFPRARYAGACNVDTVKDVNFLGPNDEFITSGSDDGNFFIWKKATRSLHGIYEGDSSIVNVVEGHPHLPLLAVSGLDTTVKLFAPTRENRPSAFARLADAGTIMERNVRSAEQRSRSRISLSTLLLHYNMAVRSSRGENGHEDAEDERTTCTFQ